MPQFNDISVVRDAQIAGQRQATTNRTNQLFDLSNKDDQIRDFDISRQLQAENQQADSAELEREQKSIAIGAKQGQGFIDRGDIPGLQRFIGERIERVQAEDGDSRDSEFVLDLINKGEIEQASSLFQNAIIAGTEKGFLKPEKGSLDDPSAVREFQFFQGLSPEQKKQFLQVKRSTTQFGKVGGESGIINKEEGSFDALSTVNEEADAAGEVAGAQAKAKADAQIAALPQKTREQALIDLPKVEATANQAISLIDDVLDESNLSSVIGFFQGRTRGLTGKQRGTVKKIEQIQGKVFLDAFERLKGGGQITELEGKAATDAQARINDRTVDEESFRDSMLELREIVEAGLSRAKTAAGEGDTATNVGRFTIQEVP